MTGLPRLAPSSRSLNEQIFRGFYAVVAALAVGLILGVVLLGIGLAQGYRPVVLTSGSMTPTAPVGSVVIARPVESVRVGDVLVMSSDARATVTHRVVEIETSERGQVFAVTRGDANSEVDAEPYLLDGPQLVGRWIIPGLGSALLWLGSPFVGLLVVGGAVLVVTMSVLSYIWSSDNSGTESEEPEAPGVGLDDGEGGASAGSTGGREVASAGQKRFALATALAVLFGFTGLAWSLYLSTNSVAGNSFGTSDCFDARVAGVQRGQVTSSAPGLASATIVAVDPAASFVTYSIRSGSSKPGDAVVLGDIVDSTTVAFLRQTDTPAPPPIVIDWSVVEFDCGVTVQRATGPGNGTATVDFPVDAVDPDSSFVIGGSVAPGTESGFENDDVSIVELVGSETVRFRTDGAPLTSGRSLGFQLIEFDDGGDLRTEVVSATLGAGDASAVVALTQPVDVNATMLAASFATSDTGPDIGQRMVRARLLGDSSVEITRLATGQSIEVNVQVVQFLEGTSVQHGVIDLAVGETSANVPIDPVDLSRSTVGSTVTVGGAASGGSTDEVSSGVAGEGLVRSEFTDAVTVSIERSASSSNSSFVWQAITWGGPSWADPSAPYRQRIDVDAASVAVPNGYTTPVTIDHSTLVSTGLSIASGTDLRLWRFDGTSWTELDRVLDETSSWNDPSTTFWFRTQESIAASTTVSYWLYFGDPTPDPPLDDPANVWLLAEGFESGLGSFEDRTEGTAWYRADPWTRRMQVTIDAGAVGSPLVDQPVLVYIASADLTANAQSDASDVYFTDAGGARLPHDIERWDQATGELSAWVRVAALDSASDTTLFLHYGAPDAPAQRDPRATWASEGVVWTMSGDPVGAAPALDDLGGGNVDGLAIDGVQRVVVDRRYAARLDGSVDRLESAPVRLPDLPLTVSAWFRADAFTGDAVLVAQGSPGAEVFVLGVDNTTSPGAPVATATFDVDGSAVTVSGGPIAPGTWHHVAAVWDQSTLELFVDGTAVGSVPATGRLASDRTAPVVVGGDATGARTLDGDVGNVRLASSAHSPDRISFEATNLSTPTATAVVSAPASISVDDQGDWLLRRPLTVSSDLTDADLTDFVLLVQLVDPDLASGTQADGDDLVFTAGDGITRLDHHLESWNAATGALTAWVRIPLLSSSADTELFVYYGNSLARGQSDPIGVWGSDIDLVLTSP